jgi:hypothetical protein
VAYFAGPPPRDPFIGKMPLCKTTSNGWNTLDRENCSYFFYNFEGAAKLRGQDGWADWRAPVVDPAPMRLNGPDGPVYEAHWALLSPGPDRWFEVINPAGDPWVSFLFLETHDNWNAMLEGRHSLYDPTNGSISAGDIWRTNSGPL